MATSAELSSEIFVLALCFLILLFFISRTLFIDDIVYITGKKRHSWKPSRILERACYCSVCEILLPSSTGLFCDCCGVCSHPACMKKADTNFKCKEKYVKTGKSIAHLWVKGNLPLNSVCITCNNDIDHDATPGLVGVRCCWCQRMMHNSCFKKYESKENQCDYGKYRDMIIPPTSIIAARTRESLKLHLTGINPPNWDDWRPLIVIANTKSGSNTGSDVLSLMRGLLHPLQVMELGSHGPHDALQWAVKASPRQSRILVAGGDGSIGWVLNTIFTLNIKPFPQVAILPLGTGNDLSRVMGWGAEPPDILMPDKILDKIQSARVIDLDRWLLEIETPRYCLPIRKAPSKNVFVYNYFSIGVDAQVTLGFHKTRESRFYVLRNRVLNKVIYFMYGTHQIVQPYCEGLEKNVELYIDGKQIELPELQSIVCLNIDSWGAGVNLCELSKTPEKPDIINDISDGVMELFGVVSSFHIAQLQCRVSKPVRIGQGKCIQIKITRPLPVQADGEPWLQQPCEMKLTARGQAKMLKFNEKSK